MSLLLWHVPGTFYEPEDVEIGILENDERGVSAKLHRRLRTRVESMQ